MFLISIILLYMNYLLKMSAVLLVLLGDFLLLCIDVSAAFVVAIVVVAELDFLRPHRPDRPVSA